MANCSNFSEQLLDFLYDLLDEEESARLRSHLESCSHCQADLHEAEGHQRLLAQAARACPDVAPFTAPDLSTPLPTPLVAPVTLPQALPLPSQPQVRGQRFPRWLRYGSVALAASVLLGVVVAQEMYRGGLQNRQSQLAAAKKGLVVIDNRHARAEAVLAEEKRALLQPNPIVQVSMTGSPLVDPSAGAHLGFKVNDLLGNVAKGELEVQIADGESKKILYSASVASRGEDTSFVVPPGLQAKDLELTVSARTVPASPPLVARLHSTEPVYVTHLALNKTSYYVRELLFFRSLTVDRFSLKPVAKDKELPLRFSLVSAAGKEFKRLLGKTGPGGISGGEFALTDDIPPGSYFLEVASLAGDNVLPQRRRLDILNANGPQVVLNKLQYNPGEIARGKLYGPNMVPQADQRVVVTTDVAPLNQNAPYSNSQHGAYGNSAQRTYTDNSGNFEVPLPSNVNSSRAKLNINIPTRTSNENVVAPISIVPAKVIVDFFPEGGDLIDGVATKVYYRIRSLEGDPVVPDGRLVVESSKKIEFESAPGKAVGVFSLTPSLHERYKVGLASDRTEVVNVNPIAKLGIQAHGLALSVPTDLIPGNEPVRAKVAIKGEAKHLLVLVTCRGQIVEQQTMLAKPGETNLELKTLADLAGILRVTVYEVKDQALIPQAERLVYRLPSRRLELAGAATKIHGGRNQWSAQCVNEQKQPVDCYLLAAVVESQFAGDNDLATHFYLDSEISNPAELENANVLVRDTPASHEALGLFLGTHGWRRFAVDAGGLHLARGDKKVLENRANRPFEGNPAESGLVSLQSANLGDLQAAEQARMNAGLKALHARFIAQARELAGEKEKLVSDYNHLALALAEYERLPGEYLRLTLSLTVLLGFVLAGVLILVGFVRLARGQFATPVFAGSIASLGVCLLLVVAGNRLGQQDLAGEVVQIKNEASRWTQVHLDEAPPNWPRKETRLLGAQGQPLLAAMVPLVEKNESQVRRAGADVALYRSEGAAFLRDQYQDGAPGGGGKSGGQIALSQGGFAGASRFGHAVEAEKISRAGAPMAPAMTGPGAAGALPVPGKSQDAAKGAQEKSDKMERDLDRQTVFYRNVREYAYGNTASPQDRCDPMLWYPATILWVPALAVKNGDVQLSFDLPEVPAQSSYRMVIQAHTEDGRLGYFDKTLSPLPQSR